MNPVGSAVIDLVEAAYDLEPSESEWLPRLMQAGLPVFDRGMTVAGVVYNRPSKGGPVTLHQFYVASGPPEFPEQYTEAARMLPVDVVRDLLRPGMVETLSERSKRHPGAFAEIGKHFSQGRDALDFTALDPNGQGVHIVVQLPEVTKIAGRSRDRWQMLAAHVSAGHRLRRSIVAPKSKERAKSSLPHDAEAVLEPKRFEVTDAAGHAKADGMAAELRNAAIQAHRARNCLRGDEPLKALEIWKALVRGRWSLVDWFDTDGKRFVLAVPNPPDVSDPRGLTERETQVVTYASFGHSNKFIAYQLGISKARVSMLLSSSMRKLHVRTTAQLVKKVRDFRGLGATRANENDRN